MRSTTGIDNSPAIAQKSRSLTSANAECWASTWNQSYRWRAATWASRARSENIGTAAPRSGAPERTLCLRVV